MKPKKIMPAVSYKYENYMTPDMWNQCCCVVASYADKRGINGFWGQNLAGKQFDGFNRVLFTANASDKIVGFLLGHVWDGCNDQRIAEIDWQFVDHKYALRGVGGSLLARFEHFVQQKHKVDVINVYPTYDAFAYYDRHGYTGHIDSVVLDKCVARNR